MNIELISPYEKYTSILEQVMRNRKIDMNNYLYLNDECLISPWKLDNIDLASEIYLKHCENNSKVLVVVDSDCDGYTSAAAIFNYTLLAFPEMLENLDFVVHENKTHGIIINDEILSKYNLIIVPDAGSNDTWQHRILRENSIDLIVLDHHQVEHDTFINDTHAALVNNQSSKGYENKMISGVGIVWKFLQVLDKKLDLHYANLFLDLVAVGMAADMQSLHETETAYLIREGLKQSHLVNPFLSTLVAESSFTIKNVEEMNYTTVSYSIAPFVNAVTRVGTIEEKQLLFMSMLFNCAYRLVPSTKKGSKKGDVEILVRQAFRVSTNVKNRQKTMKEKGVSQIKNSMLDSYDLETEKAIVLDVKEHLDKNLIGLVANEIADEFQRPVLLVSKNEENDLVGSGRNYSTSNLEDLRNFISNQEEVNWASGHPSAFGVSIKTGLIESLKERINTELKDIDTSSKYKVDYIIEHTDNKDWVQREIINIGNLSYLWGKGCEEPLIYLKDFPITNEQIHLLTKGTLRIDLGEILSAIKFWTKEEEYEQMISEDCPKTIDIVGHCSVNKWNNKEYPQIKIINYEIKKIDLDMKNRIKNLIF